MPLFNSAYATSLGKLVDTTKIEKAIKESVIVDGFYRYERTPFDKTLNPVFNRHRLLIISGSFASEKSIPQFQYPYPIKDAKSILSLGDSVDTIMCVDARSFLSLQADGIRIRNDIEYGSLLDKLFLSVLWENGYIKDMRSTLNFAGLVFTHWLGEIITKRFALDPKDQLMINVINNIYYQSLFMDTTHFSETDKDMLSIHTIKNVLAPGEMVKDVISHITKIESIDDYCNIVRDTLNNVRLRDFNTTILLNLISNSWYGVYAKENLAVALEYPPIWLSIVYTALNERTFKNSTISRIAERYGKVGKADNYTTGFKNMRKLFFVDTGESGHNALESLHKEQMNVLIKQMKDTD